ncbi:MAG: hypothetical protein ACRDZ2_05580, partial [Ilumatobacteraceae bacterium]
MNQCRSLLRLALAAVAALLTTFVPSGLAQAHGDDGVIEVTAATAGTALTITYDILLTYLNDGDLAEDATVSVAADGPGGVTVGPIQLAPTGQPGHYGAAVGFPAPGIWQVRFSSLSPLALLERSETIEPDIPSTIAVTSTTASATTTGPSTSTAPSTTIRETSTTSTTPSSTSPSTTASSSSTATSPSGDDGPPLGLVAAGGLGAVALAT